MAAPPLKEPIVTKGVLAFSWVKWFTSLVPQRPVMAAQTLSASPWTFQNLDRVTSLAVSGGTVSLIRYTSDGVTFADTGVIAGLFTLQPFEAIEVTWSVVPIVVAGYRV